MQAVFSPMMRHLCRFPAGEKSLSAHHESNWRSQVLAGVLLAASIATVAYRFRALSVSGAVAATMIGAAVYTGMGARGSTAMLAYFGTASALGRLPGDQPGLQQRGNRRDAVQVLANGGPAAAFATLHALRATPLAIDTAAGFYGSISAAAADTWATEIGTRWGGRPRSIATFHHVNAGESGGVTLSGLSASVLATLLLSAIAGLGNRDSKEWALMCMIGGLAGSLADSLLGARLQERRWCEHCNVLTEMHTHTCGNTTTHRQGLPAFNNDVVNCIAVASGGLLAAAMPAALAKLTECNGSRVEFIRTLTNSRLTPHIGAS
jgi:uncharacterized protein (TIGR00297 family)